MEKFLKGFIEEVVCCCHNPALVLDGFEKVNLDRDIDTLIEETETMFYAYDHTWYDLYTIKENYSGKDIENWDDLSEDDYEAINNWLYCLASNDISNYFTVFDYDDYKEYAYEEYCNTDLTINVTVEMQLSVTDVAKYAKRVRDEIHSWDDDAEDALMDSVDYWVADVLNFYRDENTPALELTETDRYDVLEIECADEETEQFFTELLIDEKARMKKEDIA